MVFGRRRWDPQPTTPAAVLLASSGRPLSDQAVDMAITMVGGQPIGVLTIAKIYGTSLGLQNPGLPPPKREMQEQRDVVAGAIARIKRGGGRAQGEVVATRNNVKTFVRAARRYSVRHVGLEPAPPGRLRNPSRVIRPPRSAAGSDRPSRSEKVGKGISPTLSAVDDAGQRAGQPQEVRAVCRTLRARSVLGPIGGIRNTRRGMLPRRA